MKAKELLRRYRGGDRDFRGVDLSEQSLRGMDLAGINLSGANLTGTDLRGTKLTDAKLIGTQFCEAKMGTRRRWATLAFLFSLVLSTVTAFFLAGFAVTCFVAIVEPGQNLFGSDSNLVEGLFGILGLGTITIILCLSCQQGILATLGAFTFAVAVAFAFAYAIAGTVAFAGAIAFAFTVAYAIAGAIAIAIAGAIAGAIAIAITVAFAGAFAVNVAESYNSSNVLLVTGLTVIFALFVTCLNFVISRRALSSDPRDMLIRDLAVGFSSVGGTRFHGADLTDANFSQAVVKGAHFKAAKLTRTCFHLSQKLHLSRAYKTNLANRTALNLLVSLRPEPEKSYIGLNLKGANLSHAELADVNLTEADISNATLAGANMQRATLTKVQALGTDFHQATLTATCLEAWNIDSTTQLKGAICEHVYLLRDQQERRPNSGTFAAGEFAKLFEEVLNTIDLIFRNGIDWRAFLQTFQSIQVQHEGANLEIQSIENKGDGVMVVRLNSAPEADKSAIHQAFTQRYQEALKAVEHKYKALLESRDRDIQHKEAIIAVHRQQNASMTRITEVLAQRPINVEVNATADSKAMQGNDQSQSWNVGGDFNLDANNSIVSLRDISGQVSNQINQLSGSETQAQLKDLLTQLQAAIETEPALNEDDKTEALEEVGSIAEAGQTMAADSGKSQKLAKRAMRTLKGMTAGLTETTKLVEVCNRLLPAIGLLFGL